MWWAFVSASYVALGLHDVWRPNPGAWHHVPLDAFVAVMFGFYAIREFLTRNSIQK